MTPHLDPALVIYPLLLVLPVAALAARGVPVLRALGLLLVWAAIFAVGLLVVRQRARFEPAWARVAATLGLDDQTVIGKEVRIRMAPDGHFWAKATINGVARRMLIDSGATITAVSVDSAAAAGLVVSRPVMPVILHTANGDIRADTATIKELRLGDVAARDLAVVVSPAFGHTDVLGMNFLSRLKSWRVEGNSLILTPHHPKSFT